MITALFIFTLIVSVILKLPYINIPLDRDYGLYGYQGYFWLKRKVTPYVDIQENHPPGRWLLYAFLLKYFKPSRYIFRISNISFLVFTQVVVFFIATQLFGSTVGLVSSLTFGILSSLPAFFWVQSNDEIQQIFFTALAVCGILVLPVKYYPAYYFIGISVFAALFFKQSAYINTFPVVGFILIFQKIPVINIILVLSGVLSGFVFTWLFFRANKIPGHCYSFLFALNVQSFKTHLENIFFFKRVMKSAKQRFMSRPFIHNSEGNRGNEIKNDSDSQGKTLLFTNDGRKKHIWLFHPWVRKLTKKFCLQTGLFLFLAFTGIFATPGYSIFFDGYHYICIWFVFGVVTVLLNQHLMPYHALLLLPPLSILSGFGMVSSILWMNTYFGLWFAVIIFSSVCLIFLFMMKKMIKRYLVLEKSGRGKIYTHGNDWFLNSVGEIIGRYINTITKDEDQIYVWGTEYEIYLWSQRSSPTNFLFCPRHEVSFSTNPEEEENRIIQYLKRSLPQYIITCTYTNGFQKFESLLRQYYFLERRAFGEIDFYRRIIDSVSDESMQHRETIEDIEAVNTQQDKPLVSIVIVTFNALDYTRMCLQSIEGHTDYPYEIIFVDNGSTDGTVEFLERKVYDNFNYKLIQNHENLGFAAGNNRGVAIAGGKYVMLLNNDVLVSDNWLRSLVESIERSEKIGMVGPVTNFISGRQAIQKVPYTDELGFYAFAKQLRKYNQGKLTPRRRIAGFALLMTKALYEEVGGLDETFGSGNFEDDDLCLRIDKEGYAIMVDESTYIHHFGNQTFKANKIDYTQNLKERMKIFKNKWPEVDYEELLELKETLIDKNAQLLIKGKQTLDSGKLDEAITVFYQILQTNPIDSNALSGICYALLMKGEIKDAMDLFVRDMKMSSIVYTKNKPDLKEKCKVLMRAAKELNHSGHYMDAIYSYKMAFFIKSEDGNTICIELLHMGDKLFQEEKYIEAIYAYDLVKKINPSEYHAYYYTGMIYTKMNDVDSAISNVEWAIGLNRNDPMFHNNLGVLYFKKRLYKAAETCFEKALSIDRDYTEAQENLEKVSLCHQQITEYT